MSRNGNGTSDRISTVETIAATTNYSYCFWAKSSDAPAEAAPTRVVMALEGASNEWDSSFIWRNNDGPLRYKCASHREADNDYLFPQIASAMLANTWYHIAVVYNGTDVRIYLDGVLEDTETATPQEQVAYNVHLLHFGGASLYWNGDIAEAAVWNTNLSSTDVANLADGDSPVTIQYANLVFYAPLINDVSAKNFTFTVSGTTTSAHPPDAQTAFQYETDAVVVSMAVGGGPPIDDELEITVSLTISAISSGVESLSTTITLGVTTDVGRQYINVTNSFHLTSTFSARVRAHEADGDYSYIATGRYKVRRE